MFKTSPFLDEKGDVLRIPPNGHFWQSSVHTEYSENGESFINFVGKVETIDKDWSKFCKINEVEYEQLVEVSRSILGRGRPENMDYREYYTDESIDIISNFYKRDLELFDYEF